MLSWALTKRNVENTRDASSGADESQIEPPDTPAPVFAVRALKTALFGTPAPRTTYERGDGYHDTAANVKGFQKADADSMMDARSPTKPAGILLTPGTSTSRRKRVSFGHDVKQGAVVQPGSQSGLPDECPGKFPSPWVPKGEEGSQPRPKTRLTQMLEMSRKNKPAEAVPAANANTDAKDFAQAPAPAPAPAPAAASAPIQTQPCEDQWEEVDDFERDLDATVDLNEPHSRSGKYWKTQFEDYHADAKTEMEKLVKYKQLAKSYAKKKDKEALEMNEKLKEEQEKVRQMERQLVEMGRQVTLNAKRSGGEYDSDLVDELAKQTALAMDYKQQVKELEDLLHDNDEEPEEKGSRRKRIASPRTHQTLLEAQRELRRARSQIRDLERLREERDRLKSELKFAEQRATKLADENKKMAGDASQASSKAQDLEREVEKMRRESRQKDRELKRLRDDFDQLKENAKARFVEAEEVVRMKNEKISGLLVEVESLRTDGSSTRLAAQTKAAPEAKIRSGGDSVQASSSSGRDSAAKFLGAAEEGENPRVPRKLQKPNRLSIDRDIAARETSSQRANHRRSNSRDLDKNDNDEPLSSRALRHKIDSEMGTRRASPLSNRENLQDSSSSFRKQEQQQQPPPPTSLPQNKPRERVSALGSYGPYDLDAPIPARNSSEEVVIHTRVRPTSAFIPGEQPQAQQQQQQQQHQSLRNRLWSSDSEEPQVDLVHSNFARLGAATTTTTTTTTTAAAAAAAADPRQTSGGSGSGWSMDSSRSNLPPDRRAAAIARLERKKAERARELQGLSDRNKENVKP